MMENFENEENRDDITLDLSQLMTTMMLMSPIDKPFGITWQDDKMEEFLKHLGYKFFDRVDPDSSESYRVAVKDSSSYMPSESNVYEVFIDELQSLILRKLLKD